MEYLGLILFGIFLLAMFILDLSMVISLVKTGDERRQMIIWKASTYTLLGTVGSLVIDIITSMIKSESISMNPFSTLTATAIIYFFFLTYYKKKYGN
ncbi:MULTISPECIES: hypothetical protein [Enterococcus]|uniref:hypothetical protein n=1 Tax=Enterococcus TaxID=1350 RepID=UPI00289253D9|nr:hypothetical protein [Enterococcus asini]MDT2745173.1 hypothetical protein [Enterococcus asini]